MDAVAIAITTTYDEVSPLLPVSDSKPKALATKLREKFSKRFCVVIIMLTIAAIAGIRFYIHNHGIAKPKLGNNFNLKYYYNQYFNTHTSDLTDTTTTNIADTTNTANSANIVIANNANGANNANNANNDAITAINTAEIDTNSINSISNINKSDKNNKNTNKKNNSNNNKQDHDQDDIIELESQKNIIIKSKRSKNWNY